MIDLTGHDEQGYLSDTTQTWSSASVDLLKRPLQQKMKTLSEYSPLKRAHATKKYSKTSPKLSYKVRRNNSLVQCLEKQASFKRKQNKLSNHTLSSPPRLTGCFKKPTVLFRNQSPDSDCRGSGDYHTSRKARHNQIQYMYPAIVQPPCLKNTLSNEQKFPFKSTPSGNYKVKPSQVVYESEHLSIVAADPKKITLNVGDSGSHAAETELHGKPNENWPTTCLFSAVETGGQIPFGSEFSDSPSEPEIALFPTSTSAPKPSELNLAKMGYVTDNCIDWKKFNLPKKSELQNLLLQNILNRTYPDIQIIIGSTTYSCHRIVLQCYCSYFTSISNLQVELPEESVESESFSLIYQWMLHLGTDSYKLLRRDNILSMFKAAQFLGIKELENQCWAFIDNTEIFSEDKAFLLYMDAKQHNRKDVMELMVPRVQRFFLTLLSSKEFVEFSCEEVCTFLRSNYICIHGEIEVFLAGVRWLIHDWAKRKNLAVEIMKCVRFGFIDPKFLITMKRNPHSPELLQIANIPEVSKMIDDGVALLILKSHYKPKSEDEFQDNLKSFGLTPPAPRNWAGVEKNYQSYQEFLKDLARYRSKQRLELKQSKMKLEIEKVDDDDFLSSAVLPPATQQKIKKLQNEKSSLLRCLHQMEPKDLELFSKMLCQDGATERDKSREMKSKLYSVEEEYKQKPCTKPCKGETKRKRPKRDTPVTPEEQDLAARKIQKAYRGYSTRKVNMTNTNSMQHPPSEIQFNRHWKSRSEPSLPSALLKSSSSAAGQCEDDDFFLRPGKETVFTFGGLDEYKEVDENNCGQKIYQYHRESNTWKECGRLPEPRHYHSVVFLDGKIYVAGGKQPTKIKREAERISRRVWQFDTNYGAWTRIKSMRYARHSFGFVAFNNEIFAIGGQDENERILASVERYDPKTNSWMAVRSMHLARSGLAAAVWDDCIWVAGGMINLENIATKVVEYYNHQESIWIQCSSSLRFTAAYGVMVPTEEKLYFVGGVLGLQDTEVIGSSKQLDVWDPESNTWCAAAILSQKREAHAAIYLRDERPNKFGHLFIIGGKNSRRSQVIGNVELWGVEEGCREHGVAPIPHPMAGLAALALPTNIMSQKHH